MAVATPVLERDATTKEREIDYGFARRSIADEEHNARIKRNYAMLINPETNIDEMLGKSDVAAVEATPVRDIFANKPYLVENARADAEIFRADSPVNQRVFDIQPQIVAEQSAEEEENEDLRPTLTTIQYKTKGEQKTVEESKIANIGAEKRTSLSKKEKIIIAVVVGVIVALFALIIINSAIISNINNDISSLQSSLTTAKGAYAGVSDEVSSVLSDIKENIEILAFGRGMYKPF